MRTTARRWTEVAAVACGLAAVGLWLAQGALWSRLPWLLVLAAMTLMVVRFVRPPAYSDALFRERVLGHLEGMAQRDKSNPATPLHSVRERR